MTREEELLRIAQGYSEKLSTVKTHPPVEKRYSNQSKDRIATSMRAYYKQVSGVLQAK